MDSSDNRSTTDFPAYELFAKSPWNYALCVTRDSLQQQIKMVKNVYSDNPWSIEHAPLELRVPARLLNGWTLENKNEMKFENWGVKRNERGKVIDWVCYRYRHQKRFMVVYSPPA